MTANLWAEHIDVAGFAEVLDRVGADVVAVQELQEEGAAVITDRYAHHGLSPHHDTLGTGIATRRPAVIVKLPMYYRSGWVARLDPAHWPELPAPLEVVCVHFANPIGFPWWRSVRRRRRQLADLDRYLDGSDGPLVLVGDLNASPRWPLYRRLAARLQDGPVGTGTASRTWRWQGRGRLLLRIDHALTRRVTTLAAFTVPVPGSDHQALVLDVAIDAGAGPESCGHRQFDGQSTETHARMRMLSGRIQPSSFRSV